MSRVLQSAKLQTQNRLNDDEDEKEFQAIRFTGVKIDVLYLAGDSREPDWSEGLVATVQC